MRELPIIQKTYDLIRWYVPILNRLPKAHRFALGERIVNNLYDLLEERCDPADFQSAKERAPRD